MKITARDTDSQIIILLFMIKQNITIDSKPRNIEKKILILSFIFIVGFVLFVATATQPRLSFYTVPYIVSISLTVYLLKAKRTSAFVFYSVMAFVVISAISAIWLASIYLPPYIDTVGYLN